MFGVGGLRSAMFGQSAAMQVLSILPADTMVVDKQAEGLTPETASGGSRESAEQIGHWYDNDQRHPQLNS